jgi:hypothetical protein
MAGKEVRIMPRRDYKRVAVQGSWVFDWSIIAYLIVVDKLLSRLGRVIEVRPSEKFQEVVSTHVRAYLDKGVMPPEGIAGPILNLADDIMAGRQPTLRAGDYITVQNFVKGV